MGFSQDYSDVPDWVEKPEGYQTDSMVKYEGNVFIANFWASKPGEGEANENGWRLYDELYDVTSSPADAPTRIIGYIPTWRKKEGFDYANAEMYRNITNGIISFLMFSETDLGEFEPKSVEDIDAILADVVLTGHDCGTYISIALGGATDYGFLSLMEQIGNNPGDPVLQKAVKNVVDFVNTYGLDGVDLDLECWWDKNNDANKDQGGRLKSDGPHAAGKGLTEFAKQLTQAMPDKVISAALFATSWYGNCYDPGLAEYVDWLGIMTYDLTGSWNQSPVGPQSALLKIREQKVYAEEQQGEWPGNRKSSGNQTDPMSDNPILSVEDSLWYWTNPFFTNWQGKGQNLPRNKIAAGVPIYGYDFAYGKEPDDLSGQVAPGYKVIRYKDILSQFPDAPTAANGNIKVPGSTPRPPFVSAGGTYPYAHNIYFETPDTAVTKLNFLKSVGAQGVIIWELSNDVWEEGTRGIQGGGKSVIQALYQNSGNPATRPALPSKLKPKPEMLVSLSKLKFNDALYSKALWGGFKKDDVNPDGTTQYSARLWDATEEGWEEACANAPAIIKGQWFPKPDRCKKIQSLVGIAYEMWGEFDVEQEYSDKPLWGEFKKDDCTGYGCRQYSSVLWGIKKGESWEEACNKAQAVIRGQWFDRPTRIVNKRLNIWGEFDVIDDTCESLADLVANINNKISKGNKKVSRSDLKLGKQNIHLDLGGEGYHEADGVVSGFRTAINLNAQDYDSQYKNLKIPHLILVDYSKPYPFADGFADYITMQGAPLNQHNLDEIVRMLRKGGKVGLWIDQNFFQKQIDDLASKLNSKAKKVNKYEDEFGEKAGYTKILIKDGRPPDHDET